MLLLRGSFQAARIDKLHSQLDSVWRPKLSIWIRMKWSEVVCKYCYALINNDDDNDDGLDATYALVQCIYDAHQKK